MCIKVVKNSGQWRVNSPFCTQHKELLAVHSAQSAGIHYTIVCFFSYVVLIIYISKLYFKLNDSYMTTLRQHNFDTPYSVVDDVSVSSHLGQLLY